MRCKARSQGIRRYVSEAQEGFKYAPVKSICGDLIFRKTVRGNKKPRKCLGFLVKYLFHFNNLVEMAGISAQTSCSLHVVLRCCADVVNRG